MGYYWRKKILWWDILQKAVCEVRNETPTQQAWESSKTPHGLSERWHTRTFHVYASIKQTKKPVQGPPELA